jgi:hypothetical protein
MFHDLGAGKGAVFGDVTDEEDRDTRGFGIMLELGGTLPDLTDTSSGRINIFGGDGLDGIDYKKVWLHGIDMFEYTLSDGFAYNIATFRCYANTVGSHPNLLFTFLSTDV